MTGGFCLRGLIIKNLLDISSHFSRFIALFSVPLFPLPGNLIPCFADVGTVGMLWSKGV